MHKAKPQSRPLSVILTYLFNINLNNNSSINNFISSLCNLICQYMEKRIPQNEKYAHVKSCQYKMYESRVVTDEVEDSRKLTNKLYEN